ncbi:hypothetical protein M407DRAFT_17619 [Tulasnella calospora MUT 4182]|uniref:Protein kinase domain-containing protein n=1 Tax=Tulasnella calospora MUT 4182 TaxID=1051891 RepID=A0A0C3QLL1_9AGAM|nr:hypothetical protein M407DRAFT_17619 [Tulasnella calospora MUT 4182]
MSTSWKVAKPGEPVSDVDHSIAMIVNKDADESDPHNPPNASQIQRSFGEGTEEQNTGKLSMRERLNRLPEYRIYPGMLVGTSEPLGRGGKAEVVRARCELNRGGVKSVEDVAVKKVQCGSDVDATDKEKLSKEFVHEVEILAGLSHENIIRLVGFVEDLDHETAWMVLSLEPNGNVREFLASGEWELPERLSLIKDTFRGLGYLHTRNPPIRHGDLKSLNILVSSSYRAIITDFGSARALRYVESKESDQGTVSEMSGPSTEEEAAASHQITIVPTGDQLTLTGPAWTLRWAAPEIFRDEEQPGLPSDIWAAGWVCWEVVTGEIPFQRFKSSPAVTLQVIQGKVPSTHDHAQLAQVIRLCSLMADCWAINPEHRPSAVRCCNEIEWMPSTLPSGGMPPGHEVAPTEFLLQMGELHYMQNRYENATAMLRQALDIARQEDDQISSAEALNSLARVYYAQSKYTEAVESYTQAHELYERIGHDSGCANTLWGLGEVYHTQSKYTKAAELFDQALEIYACVGSDLGRANALGGLGAVYRAQSKYAAAAECYNQAQEIYVRIGEDQGRANTLLQLGAVHGAQGMYTTAVEFLNRAQEIYARIGDDQGRANTLDGLGIVHRSQGKYTAAAEVYSQAQEIYARIGNKQGQANMLRGLGHLHRIQGLSVEAATFYGEARDLYAEIGNIDREEDVRHWLDVLSQG